MIRKISNQRKIEGKFPIKEKEKKKKRKISNQRERKKGSKEIPNQRVGERKMKPKFPPVRNQNKP